MAVESVHDNWVYALTVAHERRRIALHTEYENGGVMEYTDIVFDGVVTHHFERQTLGDDLNVLFGVEETEPRFVFNAYRSLFERTRNYGWPIPRYDDPDDLARRLTDGAKCFEVNGTCGLTGFVFAREMRWVARESRFEPAV